MKRIQNTRNLVSLLVQSGPNGARNFSPRRDADVICPFCAGGKVDSIATRESDIATLTADLEQLKAEKVELKADIKKLNEDLATSPSCS